MGRPGRNSATEVEGERRALAGLALRLDPAAVALDDPLHDGQADAGAGEFGRLVQPFERAEQAGGVRRVEAGYGQFTPETAMHLMDRGVAMKSNLHNVLFEPKSTKFWVSNASTDKRPAAEQPYHSFQLSDLLTRKPNGDSRELPMVAKAK